MVDVAEEFQAEVIAELPNLAVAKGTPILLVRGVGGETDGCFAIGQMIGGRFSLNSDWVREERS